MKNHGLFVSLNHLLSTIPSIWFIFFFFCTLRKFVKTEIDRARAVVRRRYTSCVRTMIEWGCQSDVGGGKGKKEEKKKPVVFRMFSDVGGRGEKPVLLWVFSDVGGRGGGKKEEKSQCYCGCLVNRRHTSLVVMSGPVRISRKKSVVRLRAAINHC